MAGPSDPQTPTAQLGSNESLRYVIAGLLSTINFVPASSHPESMLEMSDLVIRTVRIMGQERGNTIQTVGPDSEPRL